MADGTKIIDGLTEAVEHARGLKTPLKQCGIYRYEVRDRDGHLVANGQSPEMAAALVTAANEAERLREALKEAADFLEAATHVLKDFDEDEMDTVQRAANRARQALGREHHD